MREASSSQGPTGTATRRRRGAGLRRLAGLSVVPAVNALAPVVVFPAVASSAGAQGVAVLGLSTAAGTMAATFVDAGWTLTGPQRVARAGDVGAATTLRLSLLAKSWAMVLAVPPLVVVLLVLSPARPWEAVACGAATALGGLSPAWFFVGRARTGRLLLQDTTPRVVLLVVAATAIALTGSLVWYALALVSATAVSVGAALLLGAPRVGGRAGWRVALARGRRLMRSRLALSSGRLVSAGYIAVPTLLVAGVASADLATFAAADRVVRLVLAATSCLPLAMQPWLGSASESGERWSRLRTAVGVSVVAGALTGVVLLFTGRGVSGLLFDGVVTVGGVLLLAGAVVVSASMTTRAVGGLALVALGRVREVTRSAWIGAAVGVPLVVVGASALGAEGAMGAVAVSEVLVLVYQGSALRSASRRSHDAS